jgi:hypothetical protein
MFPRKANSTVPPGVPRALAQRLTRSRVRIEAPDDNSVVLRRVPTNAVFFSKPHTNLLVTRAAADAPLLVGVDEDLEYRGADAALLHAFADAVPQRGWRVILLPREPGPSLEPAVADALQIVGFEGTPPALPEPSAQGAGRSEAGSVLGEYGVDLTAECASGQGEVVVGRDEELQQVLAAVLVRRPRLALVSGGPGVGKTSVLRGVAQRLLLRRGPRLVVVDLARLFAATQFHSERERRLRSLLDEAREASTVLALEQLPLAAAETPHGPRLLAGALEKGARLIGTATRQGSERPEWEGLMHHVETVDVQEPGPEQLREILLARQKDLERHHAVPIDASAIEAAIELGEEMPGLEPARSITLLDAAAVRAVLDASASVDRFHVYWAVSRRE